MQRYADNLIDSTGRPVERASVYVTNAADGSEAVIYAGNGVSRLSNPIYTDELGGFAFYAADGRYTLTFNGPGIEELIRPDILLEDPADGSAALASPTGTTLVSGTWFGGVVDKVSALASSIGASLIGFVQAGVGAVVRSLQSKAQETVSVKDFGAVGDGVTDDRDAFIKAFAYAMAQPYGAKIIAPAGRYLLSAPLNLTLSKHVLFEGDGYSTQLIGATAFGFVFDINVTSSAAYGSTFQKFALVTAMSGRTSAFNVANGNAFVFDRILVQGQNIGMQFATSYAVRIRCTFDVTASEAVRFTTSAHHADLSESKFYSCGITNSKSAISFEVASNNLILDRIDCEINYKAISLQSCTSVRINGAYIENNTTNDIDFLGTCTGVSINDTWLYGGSTAFTISNVNGLSFKRNTIGKVVNFGTGVANLDVDVNATVSGGSVNVNYLAEQGAAPGGTPFTMPDGPDADIQYRASSKGAADFAVYTGSQSILAFVAIHVPGAVNYVRFEPATTGLPASVRGFGETNAGLRLIARGTGVINTASPLRVDSNVGFYGASPVAKPTVTGSWGGNAAGASLAAALATLGLITNSTTA